MLSPREVLSNAEQNIRLEKGLAVFFSIFLISLAYVYLSVQRVVGGGGQTVDITVELTAGTAACRSCTCYRVVLPVSHTVTYTTICTSTKR